MNKPLFAFWRYDRFPFVLGGEVIEMYDDGHVTAKGYTGMMFRPIKILPLEAGKTLKKKLDDLEARHQQALKEVDQEHKLLLGELFPEALERKGTA